MSEPKKFDRTKFQGAKVANNNKAAEEAKKNTETQFPGRVGYLSVGEGKTILRICPPHDPENPSLEPVSKAWLPREIEEDGKKKIKNMPIFNSRQHSPIGRDLNDEYIGFLSAIAYKDMSKEEAKKYLSHVNGYRTQKGEWVSGIRSSLGYVAYAFKGEEFGAVEIQRTVSDRMNELAIDEESDDTIAVDPFSDPDKGVSLILTYTKANESGKKWGVSKGSTPKPLTDEQLMKLDGVTSLADRFRNAYTQSDFNNCLEGLRLFDEKHGYGLFNMEDWINVVEEIHDLVMNCPDIRVDNKSDEEEEESTDTKKAPAKTTKAAVVTKPAASSKRTITNPVIENDEGQIDGNTSSDSLFDPDDDGLEELEVDQIKEYAESMKLKLVFKPAYPKSKVISMVREAVAAMTKAKLGDVNDGSDLPFKVEEKAAEPGSARDKLNKMREKSK